MSYQAAVIAYTPGWSSLEASGPMNAFVSKLVDIDETFDTGLRALTAGILQRPPAQ